VRRRRLAGASGRPLNFTVRPHLGGGVLVGDPSVTSDAGSFQEAQS
jgi:hypothetical protein